ncbi:T9SS type B sorting domain-containing protein [Galbibacter sp. BG1]|nr:T9SS type B sorting domain-containing protein [Galbibacter sp. BG1]
MQILFNSLGGPNWNSETDADPTNDWDFSGPVTNNWFGITVVGGHVVEIDLNADNNDPFTKHNLSGTIPIEIQDLQYLNLIDLSDGKIAGEIPKEITKLKNLKYLNLSNNILGGSIPIEITNMISLETLILGSNSYNSTTIYPEYVNLTNLHTLDLRGTNSIGSIPTSFGSFPKIEILRLGSNELSGTIPLELSNLSTLMELHLNYNQLSGNIPPELAKIPNLNRLFLLSNNLSGTIPPELGQITTLNMLWLGENNLSGTIPNSLGNLTFLFSLMLNHNQLIGEIPSSFKSLNNLNSIWLNNNSLSGGMQEFLHLSSALQFCDISNNEFEGKLPDHTKNTHLNFLNFSENQFQFGDFEDQFTYLQNNVSTFIDNPQAKVNDSKTLTPCANTNVTLSTVVSGKANKYQWFKDGVEISGANSADFTISNVQSSDNGEYSCKISSTIVTDLVLERNPITINVNNNVPAASIIGDFYECDIDNDGFATFSIDVNALENQLTQGQSGLSISYFDTSGNPINLISSYTNNTADKEIITARVTNASGCFDETQFSFIAIPSPVADSPSNVEVCNSYVLPKLNSGNYFTEPNGSGNMLVDGDSISSTQTLYVYAENVNASFKCSDENQFTITILNALEDIPLDVEACDSYVLPPLNSGNYFTGSGGTGTPLFTGDEITSSQIIYVYKEKKTATTICTNENSFSIIISTTPTANPITDISICDDDLDGTTRFNLSLQDMEKQLLGGQSNMIVSFYHQNGDEITNFSSVTNQIPFKETITARVSNNFGCYKETSFNLIVNTPAPNNLSTNLAICASNGEQISINTQLSSTDYTFKWLPTGETTPSIQVDQSGIYSVEIQNKLTSCSITYTTEVKESLSPVITGVMVNGNTVEVIAEGNLDDLLYQLNSDEPQRSNIFPNVPGGSHIVRVISQVCGSDSRKINVIDFPKFFTPNGDGYNDYWQILGLNPNTQALSEIYIYDRYGKLISKINPLSNGWDGTFNGFPLPASDYWFSVQLEDGENFIGHFSLKR